MQNITRLMQWRNKNDKNCCISDAIADLSLNESFFFSIFLWIKQKTLEDKGYIHINALRTISAQALPLH